MSKEISELLRIAVREDTRSFQKGGNDQDRVLWTLTEHGGSMAKSDLARRLQTRQTGLDVVLQELERAGKVKLTELRASSW
jgi:DNA-binding MarR family transcriptional regulator